jgi:hypothetical protein
MKSIQAVRVGQQPILPARDQNVADRRTELLRAGNDDHPDDYLGPAADCPHRLHNGPNIRLGLVRRVRRDRKRMLDWISRRHAGRSVNRLPHDRVGAQVVAVERSEIVDP